MLKWLKARLAPGFFLLGLSCGWIHPAQGALFDEAPRFARLALAPDVTARLDQLLVDSVWFGPWVRRVHASYEALIYHVTFDVCFARLAGKAVEHDRRAVRLHASVRRLLELSSHYGPKKGLTRREVARYRDLLVAAAHGRDGVIRELAALDQQLILLRARSARETREQRGD